MEYFEFNFMVNPLSIESNEIIIARLANLGFESFCENNYGFCAYLPSNEFNASLLESINNLIVPDGCNLNWEYSKLPDQNWNTLWESNFEPIIVDNRCLIRASFHNLSDKHEFEIVIDPKMAFGTGHHQTTHLMISSLLDENITDKSVLDMGCGTGVLAILAEMKGAKNVTAIDIDEWAFKNAVENIKSNNCKVITVHQGDVSLIKDMNFDIILANINLNILLADLKSYCNALNQNGKIFLSGILYSDVPQILHKCVDLNLEHILTRQRNDWALMAFSK